MIGPIRALAVFACTEPWDMRKSFDTLTAIVEEQMHHSVLARDVFLFVSSDRKRAKVLYFDGTRLCVFAKRLGKGHGHFAPIWKRQRARSAEMTMSELSLFIEGSENVGRFPMSPPLLQRADLRPKMSEPDDEPC